MSTEHKSIEGLRILVVEDEALTAEAIGEYLRRAGCQVLATVDTARAAIEVAVSSRPDLILMDVRLKGGMDGIQAAEIIHQHLAAPVVYLTAHADHGTLQRAKASSAYGYVLKPFHSERLLVAMDLAIDRFRLEQRLEENRLTYATVLNSISDGVIATDVNGRVRFMNSVAERLTGWTIAEAQGRPAGIVLRFADAHDQPSYQHPIAHVLSTRETARLDRDERVISRHGALASVEGAVAPVVDDLERLVGTAITLHDVTDLRKADSDLKSMAERLRAVVDTAVDGVLLVNTAGTVLVFNPACEGLFGYKPSEVVGRSIEALLPSPLSDDFGHSLRIGPVLDSTLGGPMSRATNGRCKDGAVFPAEVTIGKASFAGETVFAIVVRDVSERKQLEAALLDATAHEQRRFGADIHDGLGQHLLGLELLITALARSAHGAHLPNAEDLDRAAGVARHAIQACQSIARGLAPVSEEQGGLIVGLRDLVGHLREVPGPDIKFAAVQQAELGLSPSTTDHLYRIAQEALSNAVRHANANSINVTLDIEPTSVRLEVCDDGQGLALLDMNALGLGLRTMRYRAAIMGARFMIATNDPVGTCIVCECPQAA